MNHSRAAPNAVTKIHEINDQPHLFLFANKCIKKGEEVLFDYGERSKKVTDRNPWLNS